jgi:hypothetical protein
VLLTCRRVQSAPISYHGLCAQICGDSLTVGREWLDTFCEDGNTVKQSVFVHWFNLPFVSQYTKFEVENYVPESRHLATAAMIGARWNAATTASK